MSGRYSVGQILFGVAFIYDEYVRPTVAAPYLYNDLKPRESKMVKLTVIEAHRVPIPEQTDSFADGYVLTDGKDLFFNQYPTASYGQVSDISDRIFTRQIKDKVLDIESLDRPIKYILLNQILTDMHQALSDQSISKTTRMNLFGMKSVLTQGFQALYPDFKVEYSALRMYNENFEGFENHAQWPQAEFWSDAQFKDLHVGAEFHYDREIFIKTKDGSDFCPPKVEGGLAWSHNKEWAFNGDEKVRRIS